jgi:hypothetical protein
MHSQIICVEWRISKRGGQTPESIPNIRERKPTGPALNVLFTFDASFLVWFGLCANQISKVGRGKTPSFPLDSPDDQRKRAAARLQPPLRLFLLVVCIPSRARASDDIFQSAVASEVTDVNKHLFAAGLINAICTRW